jgi:hypothetical protein
MPLLFKIYLFSVIGACVCFPLILWLAKPIMEESEDPNIRRLYKLLIEIPLFYKIVNVFYPLINAIYTIIALMLIFAYIRHKWFNLWFDFGTFFIRKITKSAKHFTIKEWIVRHFWFCHIEYFYNKLEQTDPLLKLIDKTLKHIHDEKVKQQSEPETEPKSDKEN